MQLASVISVLESIAPTRYAESWDNVGLLTGDPAQTITRAMLTIDYTPAVADEAKSAGCDVIIAYHPPIFDGLKRITADGPASLVFDAIRRGVAIYSPHTAWDAATGGTNDVLGNILGFTERWPLRPAIAKSSQYKLVVFVPRDSVEAVSRAMFDAGAGRIGNYSSCSFRSPGTGTFFGNEHTTPAVGQKGKLEETAEIRLETVVPISQVGNVIHAMWQAHPYEEPAFDLHQLAAPPDGMGTGRIGTLPPTSRGEIFERIKKGLGVSELLVAGPTEGEVMRAAVCAGAGGELLDDALAADVDLYLTGELRHHDAIKAARAGVTIVCALHSNTERVSLKVLAKVIGEMLPDLAILVSKMDRDPFSIR